MSERYQNAEACGIEPEVDGEEPTLEQWRERCRALYSEKAELEEIIGELLAPSWQRIDTAPWNGRAVLLWKESTREHYVAARVTGEHGPGWCTPDGFEILRATHWMPLPEPPK